MSKSKITLVDGVYPNSTKHRFIKSMQVSLPEEIGKEIDRLTKEYLKTNEDLIKAVMFANIEVVYCKRNWGWEEEVL